MRAIITFIVLAGLLTGILVGVLLHNSSASAPAREHCRVWYTHTDPIGPDGQPYGVEIFHKHYSC